MAAATTLHRRTEVDGYRIHSVHRGVGPPVVLVHGLSGSLRWWRQVVPALADTFSVHLLDLAGFGASRPVRRLPDLPGMAELLLRWMGSVGISRADLVGHSMGAQVAVHAVTRAPASVRRLVLVSASGVPRRRSPSEAMRLVARAARLRSWGAPAFLPTVALDALRAGPRTLLHSALTLLSDDVRPLLPRVSAPTLVIWGALDPLLPLEDGQRIAASIPDARLVVIGEAAHNPMVDRPWEFNRVLLDFLDRP